MNQIVNMVITGRCQCGEVVYESNGKPVALYICHCKECQKQSASVFGISLDVPFDKFRIIQGTPKYWNRPTRTGEILKCAFCPNCGSRLWHEYDKEHPETISLKGGTLDIPIDLSNAIHVWTKSKLPGVIIPSDAIQYTEED